MTNTTITDPFASIFSIRAALYNATVILDNMRMLNKDNDEAMSDYIEGIETLKEAEQQLDKIKDWMKTTVATTKQAITVIRQYQDRMSVDGRAIQHVADSLEKLI